MKQEHIKSYYTINGLCLFIVCVILTSDLPQVRYSSTLIDNIYIKCRNLDHLVSGIITSDLSDHLPLFTFLGKPTREKKPPKTITFRPIDEGKLSNIKKLS